jgi:hypothetical protein
MWPLGHVGHVTYSFINMLFISTGIFEDKLVHKFCRQALPQMPLWLSRNTCSFNSNFLNENIKSFIIQIMPCKISILIWLNKFWFLNILNIHTFVHIYFDIYVKFVDELIFKNPRWYEQHIYETVCHMTNMT